MERAFKVKTFEMPTAIKHGLGALGQLADELALLGVKKPLLVTDQGVVKAGLLGKMLNVLDSNHCQYAVFDQVKSDPPVELVGQGREIYRSNGCDGLIAMGGGSPMDTAKAIGVEVAHGGNILDYEAADGKLPLIKRIPPLIAIPTTAGTGSEVSLWAVITDPKRQFKFNVGGPLIAAHVALIDPTLHVSLPANVTAATGMDALCHAIECYTSHYAQSPTDAVALLAIDYAARYLRRAYAYGNDLEARYGMAMSAMLAGISYGSESAGAVHAMAQTLGGIVSIPHGVAVGTLLAPVMEYNWMGWPDKYKRIAQMMGVDTNGMDERGAALSAVKAVADLAKDVGIPSLRDYGITEQDIPRLAREAAHDPQTVENTRDIDEGGYEAIYRKALI
ncbi:alcohol dehydrogenase [Peptococcaceae bacterium CEB3]|nr:alcohol dehydrogenase [Peptococcaceae bacterium CEB3]